MSDFDYSQFEETPEPKKAGNRTFAIIASILGAIILLALVAGAAYAIFILPEKTVQQADLISKISAENTATVMAATNEALAQALATNTPVPAATEPAIEEATTEPVSQATDASTGGELTEDMAITATVSALLTQAAGANPAAVLPAAETATPVREATIAPAPTALPSTGFADEMGLPGLVGLAFLFITLILITRQIRAAQLH